MFQKCDFSIKQSQNKNRLEGIRFYMKCEKLDVLIIPHTDEHRNEYLPAHHERLAWISDFTGSEGMAIITLKQALLFVDGRYTIQASKQMDLDNWVIENLITKPPSEWLRTHTIPHWTVGIDPWLHSHNEVKILRRAVQSAQASLKYLPCNPIDVLWNNKPFQAAEPISIHPPRFSGRSIVEKLENLSAYLNHQKTELCILTDPNSFSWLFNIRGRDIVHTPVVLGRAILRADHFPLLFIDKIKLNTRTYEFLNRVSHIYGANEFSDQLKLMVKNKKILMDPDLVPEALWEMVENATGTAVTVKDPISILRAQKNKKELEGARHANLRDGAAISSFLAWLDEQPPGSITEIDAVQKLETIRWNMEGNMPMRDLAFNIISGSGPNGAIIHYDVTKESNRVLGNSELYLCDSGAQYLDGTTDITRTIAIGVPTSEQCKAFTLVLKGHINLALACFPTGTRGMDLDILARLPLWKKGMDYAHGTGHGVGSYLSVHEGSHSISKHGNQELLPGMIISNEPGYYREGEFGIRIENLMIVKEAADIPGGDQSMLSFELISFAPIDCKLIDPTLMTDIEIDWLNTYHALVQKNILPLVDRSVAQWIIQSTYPIMRS
ncbi:aminopeptidase P family protein [Candidatus Endowatersipora endosymbiont of Watersipora subatra]|uniref:aminopeptidase P family protein n=1 Tax=Candidatus Endowatersipora endosymbiont of Watersipora subatra TaxID=3077946 RepID=UPI00312C90A8